MQFQWSPWSLYQIHTLQNNAHDGFHTCALNSKHDAYANLEGKTIIVDIL